MTTEILGFIIILGAVIVLFARRQLNKVEDDPEVVEASTGRLLYELEQSANEIISRMSERIDYLEKLLREADYKAELLQRRIDSYQAMQDIQSTQQGNKQTFDDMLVQQMEEQEKHPEELPEENTADYYSEMPENQQVTMVEEEPQERAQIVEPTESSPQNQEPLSDAQLQALQFIREASMVLEEKQQENVALASEPVMETMAEPKPISNVMQETKASVVEPISRVPENLQSEDATQQAKKMLSLGYTPESVAKATGLGLSAVNLIFQLQNSK